MCPSLWFPSFWFLSLALLCIIWTSPPPSLYSYGHLSLFYFHHCNREWKYSFFHYQEERKIARFDCRSVHYVKGIEGLNINEYFNFYISDYKEKLRKGFLANMVDGVGYRCCKLEELGNWILCEKLLKFWMLLPGNR